MKKILSLLPILLIVLWACSDDDEVRPSDLPENDLNISVPEIPKDWAPGMDYKPYVDNLPEPGVPVNVLVVCEGKRGQQAASVLNNEAWIWSFSQYGKPVVQKENVKWCYFPKHKDIHVEVVESLEDFDPTGKMYDIVVLGAWVENLAEAQRNMKALHEKFNPYPLVVVPGGEYQKSTFSKEAWSLCVRLGGLDWEHDVLAYFPDWETDEYNRPTTDEQAVYYHPGNVGAAYAVQDVDGYSHADDWLVVGRYDGSGNLPGRILVDHWISAPFAFNVDDLQASSTVLGAAYVAKIDSEIKRRLPHYTNEEITGLICDQVDNLGDKMSYGFGMINPKLIWNAVENLENTGNVEQE